MKKFLFAALTWSLVLGLATFAQPLEKLKIGTSVRTVPLYYLTIFAGEEKGIWKENGLDVEWVPFRSSADQTRAMAAGDVKVGLAATVDPIVAISRGVPVVIISAQRHRSDFTLWVRADSSIKEIKDLKGAKLGIARFGVPSHIYGQMIAKISGLEKDIRFVAAGGVPEVVAAMKAGHIVGTLQSHYIFIDLQLKKEVRELVRLADYLPKEWVEGSVFALKDFARKSPDTLRKTIKAILQSLDYIRKDPNWAIEKMKKEAGYSDQAARIVYQRLDIIDDGKISVKSLENVMNFLIEYGLVSKEKMPPIDQIYTGEFLG